MKSLYWIGVVVLAALGVAGGLVFRGWAEGPAVPAAPAVEGVAADAGPVERLLLSVERVTCGSCEARIRAALEARPGVRAVAVDLAGRTVTVEYAAGGDDPKSLAEAVTRAGYPARYVASGPAVPRPAAATEGARGGCGGACCSGG